jgi:hypothetical protein
MSGDHRLCCVQSLLMSGYACLILVYCIFLCFVQTSGHFMLPRFGPAETEIKHMLLTVNGDSDTLARGQFL